MLVGWLALLVIFLCILIFGDFWWFLLRITSVKCVKEVYNLRNPIHCLTLLMPQLSILMPQQIFLFVSFLHHRGQLWPDLWQLWRPFSCRNWLFLEKMMINNGPKLQGHPDPSVFLILTLKFGVTCIHLHTTLAIWKS